MHADSPQKKGMKKALYPGSFDPITNGHVDIVKRALQVFDQVLIAISHNQEKSPVFSLPEREELIKQIFVGESRIVVCSFEGLLVDFAKKMGAVHVVRGLRAASDFEYEFQLAAMNRCIEPQVDSVFFMTGSDTYFLSSRLVKEVAFLGGDITKMVPHAVVKALAQKRAALQKGGKQ